MQIYLLLMDVDMALWDQMGKLPHKFNNLWLDARNYQSSCLRHSLKLFGHFGYERQMLFATVELNEKNGPN